MRAKSFLVFVSVGCLKFVAVPPMDVWDSPDGKHSARFDSYPPDMCSRSFSCWNDSPHQIASLKAAHHAIALTFCSREAIGINEGHLATLPT